jgi:hypothetical protein
VNGSSVIYASDYVTEGKQPITLEDLKQVHTDLTAVNNNLKKVLPTNHTAEEKSSITLEDLKEVYTDLTETNNNLKQSLKNIDKTTDMEDNKPGVNEMDVTLESVPEQPETRKTDKVIKKPETMVSGKEKKAKQGNQTVKITLIPVSNISDKQQTVESVVDNQNAIPEYIKYDHNGNMLDDETENWACVRDTNTGLMWEIKSHDDDIRNADNLYTWYKPGHEILAGKADGGRCTGKTNCDTADYVRAMNDRKHCGYDDWQLPTREQMQTLVDMTSEKDEVKINKRYFPNTRSSWYWTSSDEDNGSNFAWYVLFRNGVALSDLKERPKHIRLVRVE